MTIRKRLFMNRSKALLKGVFSTDIYTGATPPVSIVNDVDLLNETGVQFFKRRNASSYPIFYNGAVAGGYAYLTCSSGGDGSVVGTAFDIGDWTEIGIDITTTDVNINESGGTYVVHTFRESPKFFDYSPSVPVTSDNTIAFADLETIGMVVCFDVTGNSFFVWHRSLTSGKLLKLNTNAEEATLGAITVSGTDVTLHAADIASPTVVDVMAFAHDASTLGKIVCGSYPGNGSITGPIVTTGMEPKYIMIKRSIGGTGDWVVVDSERGISETGNDAVTRLNSSAAESSEDLLKVNSNGFQLTSTDTDVNANGSTYVYMVIH